MRRIGTTTLLLSTVLSGSWAMAADSDDSLSWHGITLYGVIDAGVSYQSHGAPFNDGAATNVNNFLIKDSNRSNLSLASNGLSTSTIGIRGREPLAEGWWGLFQVDTGFNPASGTLIDGPGSDARNNGLPLTQQSSYGDSTRAGQAFNGRVFLGVESSRYGSLTLGRNSTVLNDGVCKYDPLSCSLGFSYLGFFGATAGTGDTEDRFLDDTLKYSISRGPVHGAALYQFGSLAGLRSQQGNAWQADIGVTLHEVSLDGIVARKKDAVAVGGPLSAAQVAALATPGSSTFGLAADTTVPGTVSDNRSYTALARYEAERFKLFAGYEHVEYQNPGAPLAVGTAIIGGYRIIPNNSAFPNPKNFQILWGGVKYSATASIDIVAAYYHAAQNSYGTKSCSDASASTCSGHYEAASLVLDYRFNRRVDFYGGVQRSAAYGGIDSGYLQSSSFDPMIGGRFSF